MADSRNQQFRVCASITPVLSQPSEDAICTSEALYGERLEAISEHDAWIRVRQLHDDYTGYVDRQHLQSIDSDVFTPSTHWVMHRSTLLFSRPEIKSQVMYRVPFGSELALVDSVNKSFSRTDCGHFVWTDHCLPLSATHPAGPLELSRMHFLGAPYLWGGRSPEGVDCSGLVQALARSQGLSLPRDSGDQEAHLQISVAAGEYRSLDLTYWPGHCGILVTPTMILHATAYTLSCGIEPLRDVIARAGPLSSVKRLFP
jgi:hypothetical protein